MFIKYLMIYLSTAILRNKAAKILAYFPVPSLSHQFAFRPFTQELARRGHEVTVITTDPAFPKGQTPTNLTEIDVHNVSYRIWNNNNYRSNGKKDISYQLKVIVNQFKDIFAEQMKVEEVKKIIRDDEKYDLLIIQSTLRQTLALLHTFKVPTIQISSFSGVHGEYESFGPPMHPFLYPVCMQERIFNLTVWEHFTELYKYYKLVYWTYLHRALADINLRETYDPKIPALDELANNVDMFFTNIIQIWEGVRPTPHNVIYMGGVHLKPPKDLPKDLQNYLEGSQKGVIVVSFGTNVKLSQLPLRIRNTLLNVLSLLPYDVLLKWDEDNLPISTRNIKISKWLPQADILHHRNVKLFISQGGLQSTDEAISAGVPIIGIPTFGDQWSNAEKYVHFNIGQQLNMASLTEEKLSNAINTILNDLSNYRRNIARLRDIMYDQPQRPLERAVWWTEYVLRHRGARHLRAPAANMPAAEYFELELLFIVSSVLLLLIIVIMYLLYCSYMLLKRIFCNCVLKIKG